MNWKAKALKGKLDGRGERGQHATGILKKGKWMYFKYRGLSGGVTSSFGICSHKLKWSQVFLLNVCLIILSFQMQVYSRGVVGLQNGGELPSKLGRESRKQEERNKGDLWGSAYNEELGHTYNLGKEIGEDATGTSGKGQWIGDFEVEESFAYPSVRFCRQELSTTELNILSFSMTKFI